MRSAPAPTQPPTPVHPYPHSVVTPGRLHGVVSADTVEEVARRVADMGGEEAEDGAGGKRRKGGKRWVWGGYRRVGGNERLVG